MIQCLSSPAQQQPFELIGELACFSAAQLGLDAGLIELYRKRQPTISEHLEDLLVVKPDETSSGLQVIKANPSKPSVDAMLTLLDKQPRMAAMCCLTVGRAACRCKVSM